MEQCSDPDPGSGIKHPGSATLLMIKEDQKSMQKTVRKIVDEDINPFVDQWETAGEYPAHQVC
jgi:hypothetical protein